MHTPLLFCGLLAAIALCTELAQGRQLLVAKNGRSDFAIVVADNASPSTKHGAAELQMFLREMTGAQLPVISDRDPVGPHEIMVGDSAHLRQLELDIPYDTLGPEGYLLRTAGPHLVITGGPQRGAMYGVYGLLEDHLGCHWFTPDVSRIPTHDPLVIGPLDETRIPLLEYREPFVIDCFDGDWNARNRMNGNAARLEEKHGGKVTYVGFSHTFFNFISPREYFDDHPEYFSEIDGKRTRDRTQLCCTNEDVIRIIAEKLRQLMRDHPEGDVFSVTQMDWRNYCQCPECSALIEKEGTPGAPVFYLINRVAEALADEFPDKAIDTFAYQWSRKPPKTIRPHPNVIIRLCSIECCFSHPIRTCDSEENARFREDIAAWSKISDRLWVWDYVTCFDNYLLPFPNLRVLDDNIRFFVENSVTGIFEEGNYQSLHGELAALRGYLLAKFLWNPNYDPDRAVNEFLDGVYGAAAGPIRRYIDLIHDKVERDNIHIHIGEKPDAPYLPDDLLAAAVDLWDQAEAAVADQPEVLERVKLARLSIDWTLLERTKESALTPYRIEEARYGREFAPAFAEQAERFFSTAEAGGLILISEWRRESLFDYRKRLESLTKAYEALSPSGRDLRLDIVPDLGGRIVGIRALPDGPNLCYLPADDPDYPRAGGYAESWGPEPRGPGWSDSFDAVLKESTDSASIALVAALENRVRLQRTIRVPRSGTSFEITSTVTNIGPTSRPADLRTSLALDLGPTDEVAVCLPGVGEEEAVGLSPAEDETQRRLSFTADQLSAGLILANESRGVGVRILPSGDALHSAEIYVDPQRPCVTVELLAKGELPPGGSSALRQEFELL